MLTGPVVRASFGTLLVFYNVTVISYSLPFVGEALFESGDAAGVAIKTLGLVAVGYVAKPLAQLITGPYADRHGRKPVLVGASVVAALASLLLAVLPTVDSIGLAAPILFVVAISLQAGAAGSEWPLLAAYVAESTPAERRAFTTSFAALNVMIGWLLAILVPLALTAALSSADYADWGWRLAFVPAIALGLLSFVLRRRLPESPAFDRMRRAGGLSAAPVRDLFRHQARTWLALVLHTGMVSAAFFLTVAYPVAFVALADTFTQREALVVGLAGLVMLVAGVSAAGALGDRIGPRRVSATGFLLFAALAFPAYALMSEGSIGLAVAGAMLLGAAMSLPAGVYEAWIVSSVRLRYVGSAATCNGVAVAAFGTPAIWVATQLARDHGYLAAAPLLVAVGLVGALCTRLLQQSVNEPLR